MQTFQKCGPALVLSALSGPCLKCIFLSQAHWSEILSAGPRNLCFPSLLGHSGAQGSVRTMGAFFFLRFFFLMWTIFKVFFIEFVTILLLFYVLVLLAMRLHPPLWKVKSFKILPCRSCHEGPQFSFWISAFPGFLEALCSTVFCFAMTQKRERRMQWHPTPVLLPGKSHGQRSLGGCSPWGHEGQTRLSDFTFTFHFHALEKELATHSSVLAWRIPGTAEPGGLQSMGSHRVRHDWLKWLSSSSVSRSVKSDSLWPHGL